MPCDAGASAAAVPLPQRAVLHRAEHQVAAAQLQGSATVCVVTINLVTGQLHSANLGDSGFLVFAPTHVSGRGGGGSKGGGGRVCHTPCVSCGAGAW